MPDQEAPEKLRVTLVQGFGGKVERVRVAGAEFPVQFAGPVSLPGRMGVSLTIDDVEVAFEALPVEAPQS